MNNKTVSVDYGRDIADLRKFVIALQGQVNNLEGQVGRLQKQLEESGTLYGGAVAYSTAFVSDGEWYRKLNNLGEAI